MFLLFIIFLNDNSQIQGYKKKYFSFSTGMALLLFNFIDVIDL